MCRHLGDLTKIARIGSNKMNFYHFSIPVLFEKLEVTGLKPPIRKLLSFHFIVKQSTSLRQITSLHPHVLSFYHGSSSSMFYEKFLPVDKVAFVVSAEGSLCPHPYHQISKAAMLSFISVFFRSSIVLKVINLNLSSRQIMLEPKGFD